MSSISGRVVRIGVMAVTVVAVLGAQEPIDRAALTRIRDEGMNRSHAAEPFDMFVNVIGQRLTGSPEHKRAAEYARDTLVKWGLSNVHLEPWQFGRGWQLQKLTIEMIEPRYMPLIGYAEAWTPSTPGELVVPALSTAGKSATEIAQMPIAGAAVLTQPVVTAFIDKDRAQPTLVPGARIGAPAAPREPAANAAAPGQGRGPSGAGSPAAGARGTGAPGAAATPSPTAKAAVMIKPSRGMHGTVFVQAQSRDTPANTQPAIVLAAEHYNIIARLIEHKIPVKLRVNVQTKFFDTDLNSYNVIADIPGTDPVLKDEVVILGGHLDSWHTGTGATDNADGAAEVMEAFRIIKASGLQPRRTLRLALWSGEEEGLYGSKHFVTDHLEGDAHKADRDKVDVYFNIDPGTGPIYGWYMENNPEAKAIFDEWLEPLKDIGMRTNVLPGITNTDHLSFKAVGIPAFNPIQEYADYDVRLHHTNVDTAERVAEADLKQASVVLATYAYLAAQRAARIPRGSGPTSGTDATATVTAPATSTEAVTGALPATSRSGSADAPPPGSVAGVLKNANGDAMANASVQLRSVPSGSVVQTTRTDGTGAFRFESVLPTDYAVAYVTEGAAKLIAVSDRLHVATGATVTTMLRLASPVSTGVSVVPPQGTANAFSKPQSTTVLGYLRDGGSTPIADVPIRLRDATSITVIATMRTNAMGQFQFLDVVPGTYVVEQLADKSGRVLAVSAVCTVTADETIAPFIRMKGVR